MTFATSTMTMTREELIEFAALDAFGLLDEYDADRYTRAFNDAPSTVQDEIRQLQAELSIDPTLLIAAEEPPIALRERVLAAVAAAIEREDAQLAPLASIGRNRHSTMDAQDRRPWFASSGMFWRAACFVLAAGCLLLAYQWASAVREGNTIAKLALNNRTDAQLGELIGPDFEAFIRGGKNTALAMRPVDADFPGQATIYTDEATGMVFVLATLLPAQAGNEPYSIRVKVQDAFETVANFVNNGPVAGFRIERLTAAMLASTSWEIVNASGAVVLTTDPISRV